MNIVKKIPRSRSDEALKSHLLTCGYTVSDWGVNDVSMPTSKEPVSPFGAASVNYAYLTSRAQQFVCEKGTARFILGRSPEHCQVGGESQPLCLLAPQLKKPWDAVQFLHDASICIPRIVIKNTHGLHDIAEKDRTFFRELAADEWWHPETPDDDQTFPEVSLLCRQPFKHPSNMTVELLSVRDRGYFRDTCVSMFEKWETEWIQRKMNSQCPFFSDFFEMLLHLAFDLSRCEVVLGLWRDGVFCGYFIADFASRWQLDLWGGVIDRDICKLGHAMQCLKRWGNRRGVELLNLGGSETEGLHHFKLSLGPSIVTQRHILVFER